MSNIKMFPLTESEKLNLRKVEELGLLNSSNLAYLLFELKQGISDGIFTPSDIEFVEDTCRYCIECLQEALS